MDKYEPPFKVTGKIISLVAEISEIIGRIHVSERMDSNPHLRRENRIKTIYSSLAIENNTLSLEQVTAIINGKRVFGMPNEIQEVKNAFEAYEQILHLNPFNIDHLLFAHGIMMQDLVQEAGRFRSGGVGVFNGGKLIHMAPPAQFVRRHIENLLKWVEESDLPMLIKSCVFHYEFEFIHPFQDGNGRMGRMWHTLLLSIDKPMFIYLPIETLIKERQQGYYEVLSAADKACDCAVFVEFLLQVIRDALVEIGGEIKLSDKVKRLLEVMSYEPMSAKEIMGKLGLTRGQTFRDAYLRPAMEQGLVEMTQPNNPNSRNQKYFKK
ncbi:MAG: Fic family protein [Clostridia bacterium]|nr:Fic family protein [Clostridia bacterium]